MVGKIGKTKLNIFEKKNKQAKKRHRTATIPLPK